MQRKSIRSWQSIQEKGKTGQHLIIYLFIELTEYLQVCMFEPHSPPKNNWWGPPTGPLSNKNIHSYVFSHTGIKI